jgi:hypothetical protein
MKTTEDEKLDKQPPKKNPNGWMIYLIPIGLIAWIVWAQIEAHSPEAQIRREQTTQNAINSVYQDTYSECTGNSNESECRSQAAHAAEMARDKLGILNGR